MVASVKTEPADSAVPGTAATENRLPTAAVEVVNGNGIHRMARNVANYLAQRGVTVSCRANSEHW